MGMGHWVSRALLGYPADEQNEAWSRHLLNPGAGYVCQVTLMEPMGIKTQSEQRGLAPPPARMARTANDGHGGQGSLGNRMARGSYRQMLEERILGCS
jgi:hypothetical protein